MAARKSMKCPRCEGSMTLGFPVDRSDNMIRMQAWWVEGKPERGKIVGGVKTRKRRVLAIESWRCEHCGYLESYANTPPTDPWWS